jgi:hypothetical protein
MNCWQGPTNWGESVVFAVHLHAGLWMNLCVILRLFLCLNGNYFGVELKPSLVI